MLFSHGLNCICEDYFQETEFQESLIILLSNLFALFL